MVCLPAGGREVITMKAKGKHITRETRERIEAGIAAGDSARSIARDVGVSPSTVTREVRNNRTVREPARNPKAKLAVRCARYRDCEVVGGACEGCRSAGVRCRDCRSRSCIDSCAGFELRMCPRTERWPFVCPPKCPKRAHCSFPKCSYRAADADVAHRARLSSSRSGVDLTEDELAELDEAVTRLVRQGHSFEAIVAEVPDLGVCVRTLYNYQEAGILSCANAELPRKARVRKRRRTAPKGRDRVDRTGRTYDDFLALPPDERAGVVMGDSVEGFLGESSDVLSLHLLARHFQIYLLKGHGSSDETVARLDEVEAAMGSRAAFAAVFRTLLVDRGVEFDDWEGMERSGLEPGERRCRVFYCDAMDSNQKSEAERNHEQLRRILPKGRTHMDLLTEGDVATCCSHVNSYPLESLGGKCPFDALGGLFPEAALASLGIARLDPSEVVLLPRLMPHAVEQ